MQCLDCNSYRTQLLKAVLDPYRRGFFILRCNNCVETKRFIDIIEPHYQKNIVTAEIITVDNVYEYLEEFNLNKKVCA